MACGQPPLNAAHAEPASQASQMGYKVKTTSLPSNNALWPKLAWYQHICSMLEPCAAQQFLLSWCAACFAAAGTARAAVIV